MMANASHRITNGGRQGAKVLCSANVCSNPVEEYTVSRKLFNLEGIIQKDFLARRECSRKLSYSGIPYSSSCRSFRIAQAC